VLAERVPARAGRVLEVDCGLGLRRRRRAAGARVFADRVAAPLAFVREMLHERRRHSQPGRRGRN
jgi:hypothetical protein